MRIKYLTGPKAGIEEHVSNETGRVLVGAGIVQEIPAAADTRSSIERTREKLARDSKPAPPEEPRWSVELMGGPTVKTWFIIMRLGAQEFRYCGKPEVVNAMRTWEGGGRYLSGFGRECPKEIVKLYEKAYDKALPLEKWPIPDRSPNEANTRMAEDKKLKEHQLRINESQLQDVTKKPERLIAAALGGPDESDVIWTGTPQH